MLCSKYTRERYWYKTELIIINNINEDIKKETKSEEEFFNSTLLHVQLDTEMHQRVEGHITTTKFKNSIQLQYVIRLNYSYIRFRLEEIFNQYKNRTMQYKDLINYVFKSLEHYYYKTMVHELQHGYDAYRSDNKYFKNKSNKKIQYKDYINKDYNYNAYLNQQHEINARYSETLAILKNHYNNFSNIEDIEWDRIYNEFKNNFNGWNILDEKNKKRLINRLKVYFDSLK